MIGRNVASLRSPSSRMPRVRVSAKLYAARWLEWCDTIAPLGSAVVPEVNRICQMSSPWISADGSVTG